MKNNIYILGLILSTIAIILALSEVYVSTELTKLNLIWMIINCMSIANCIDEIGKKDNKKHNI